MHGFISGYSDTSSICYCPTCGERISECFADGTARCDACGMRFGVIEVDDDEETEDEIK